MTAMTPLPIEPPSAGNVRSAIRNPFGVADAASVVSDAAGNVDVETTPSTTVSTADDFQTTEPVAPPNHPMRSVDAPAPSPAGGMIVHTQCSSFDALNVRTGPATLGVLADCVPVETTRVGVAGALLVPVESGGIPPETGS
jgi:hypothetical protein